MKSTRGFSLLETLLYLGIFAIVGGSLFGILTNMVRVTTREVSGDEISSQLQFAIGTITRLVRDSSVIEMATSTATTTIKLRMPNSAQDPTCISLVGGVLKLAQGPDPFNKQNCTATTTDITTGKVIVDSAAFKRLEFPGGHDQVAVDLQLSNTATGVNKISRALHSGISRASAATFDSDLLPNVDGTYEVGSSIPGGKKWKNAAFSGTVGIGISSTAFPLYIYGASATPLRIERTSGANSNMVFANSTPSAVYIGLNPAGNFGVGPTNDLTAAPFTVVPASGNVGIGVPIPTYKLQLGADSAAKPTSNVWTIASDERIKTNINDFNDGLSTLLNIRPRTYQYNGRGGVGYDDQGTHIGIIAQELQSVAPYMVGTFQGMLDGQKTTLENYDGQALPFIIVNAIKEQQQQIESQKKDIESLKTEIASMKSGK